MGKDNLNKNQLESLCVMENEEVYIAKQGNEYIDALKLIFPSNNINDNPFTLEEIRKQPTLEEFDCKGLKDFIYICELIASPLIIDKGIRKNEKIIIRKFNNEESKKIFNTQYGVVYLITFYDNATNKEHFIKVGSTRTTFKKRLGSYNCGVVNNWRTASTTNIKILQSFHNIRKPFKLYIYPCSSQSTYEWHGYESVPFADAKYLAVEDILIKLFINKFKHKPLGNVQANATAD